MRDTRHLGRWIVFGLVVMIGIAAGAFIAMRPLVQMRVPRVPTHADETPKIDAEPANDTGSNYVDGNGSTTPPDGFPVKVNQRSGIYHLHGDLAYDRTVPSRFYRTAESAEADGFRHALR